MTLGSSCKTTVKWCIAALCAVTVLAEASPAVQDAGPAEESERRFVAALSESPMAMADLLADDFVYLTTTNNPIGKTALLDHLRSGRTVMMSAQREPTHLIERKDTVVTSGVLTVQVRHDGTERTIRSRYLHVWARPVSGSAWVLLARQATEMRSLPP
jgi:ketosteroid isomerase-like protein